MKRLLFTGAILLFAAMFTAIGCSDDDSGTPADQGDLTDPAFLFVDDFLGSGMNNISFVALEKMSYMIDSVIDNEVPKMTGKAQYNIHHVPGGYTEDNDWYVFDDSLYALATASDEADSIFYAGDDSLGFFADGALAAPPDLENLDSVGLHYSGEFVIYGDEITLLNMDYTAAYTITGEYFGADVITVDGTAHFTITGTIEFDTDDVCDVVITVTLVYTDMDMDATDELFPVEGHASATAVITQTCETGSSAPDVSGTWTAAWVLGNGSATNTYTRGNDTWIYTESLDD